MSSIALTDLAILGAAIVLAAAGGDAFLKGVLGISGWLRVPKLLVATTLAAFATSSPELTVSIVAALSGKPEIGLGDALGSNVVNIALILGLALRFSPIRVAHGELRRDLALGLAVPLLTLAMATDGVISRWEGNVLLLVFVAWMGFVIQAGRRAQTARMPEDAEARHGRAVALGIVGLMALVVAGRLFVSSAGGIAGAFGIHPYVVGATIVAIGTSLPELMTVIMSRLRGHDEVGVGTLLGSNLFNGLAIVGTAASIHPIEVPLVEIAIAIVFGMVSMLLMVPGQGGLIARGRGAALLCVYVMFVGASLSLAHVR